MLKKQEYLHFIFAAYKKIHQDEGIQSQEHQLTDYIIMVN